MIGKFKFGVIANSLCNKYSSICKMVVRFTIKKFDNWILLVISLMIKVHKIRLSFKPMD